MRVRSLGLQTDLMVRQLTGSEVIDHGDHLVVRTPENPTFWWGNYLLVDSPLSKGARERWEQRFVEEFPDARHRAIAVDGTDGVIGDEDALEGSRLSAIVDTALTATSLVEPRRPEAVIRMLESDADWEALADLRFANSEYQHSEPHRQFIVRKVASERRAVERGDGWSIGGFVDGYLASSLGLFTDRQGMARFQIVGTHPDFRQRGLAARLVYEAGSVALATPGVEKLVMVADPEYVAIAIYRAVGFRDAETVVTLEAPPPETSRAEAAG